MTVNVSLRREQATPLTWTQVDDNFASLAAAAGGSVTIGFGSTADRPASPAMAQPYFDTTLGFLIITSQISPSVIWVNMAGYPV